MAELRRQRATDAVVVESELSECSEASQLGWQRLVQLIMMQCQPSQFGEQT